MEFEFRLETNEGVPAERAIAVTAALVRALRALPAFPEDGQIEIVEAGRGSFRTKLAFYSSIAGAFAGIGSFGADIADLLKQPESELANCVAWTMVDDGVTKAGIRCAGNYEVLRSQMPAVANLTAKRIEVAVQDSTGTSERAVATPTPEVSAALDKAIAGDNIKRPRRGSPRASTFSNIPPEPESAQVPGRFVDRGGNLLFAQPDGQAGLLEDGADISELPLDVPVVARLSAIRGSQGGWADRRLRVLSWLPAGKDGPMDEPRQTPDIWRRGGDDEEFDLLPGQQAEDLRNIHDPGHDLYDQRSIIGEEPVAAFVGELVEQEDDIVLITEDGDSFLLEGDIEYPDQGTGRSIVVIGRAGNDQDEAGRRLLLVDQALPIHS